MIDNILPSVTVSELKAKAASAASSGAEKLQNMKDRSTRFVPAQRNPNSQTDHSKMASVYR
jgi:hypothetical protein